MHKNPKVVARAWDTSDLINTVIEKYAIQRGIRTRDKDGSVVWKQPGIVVRKFPSKYGTPVLSGTVAGSVNRKGYRDLKICFGKFKVSLKVHHAAWILHYGTMFPEDKVCDHKDGNRQNNDPRNLRAVSHFKNAHNRSKARSDSDVGLLGVSWHSQAKTWRVRFQIRGSKNRSSKCFIDPVEAVEHYWKLKLETEPNMLSTWHPLKLRQMSVARSLRTGRYAELQSSVRRFKNKRKQNVD